MKHHLIATLFLFSLILGCKSSTTETADNTDDHETYDLIVYGSTSAGVIAAYTAGVKGLNVLLISPDGHIGGLTSGGLGYTDIGNKYAVQGLALDFYRKVGAKYGNFEQWIFEPHVASEVYDDYIARARLKVLRDYRITSASMDAGNIRSIALELKDDPDKKKTLTARVFIDASYEGDVMARAGITYVVGREANAKYDETFNGVQLRQKHQFPDGIDPYMIKGDPSSGLLWGISDEALAAEGTGDNKLQAYNFRICLTNVEENRLDITRPDDYDSTRYALLLRLFEATPEKRRLNDYFILSNMPNGKTDINNRGAFSTDMIGMNYNYPEGSYEEREKIIKAHEDYTKGLLYFYKTDPRVPEEMREEMQQWGYPVDEYPDNNHWTPQLYLREVRRMTGEYVMTQHHCQGREMVEDGVAMAAYTMDSHNCQRIVVEKEGMSMVKNEGNVEIGGFGPYPISYRSIIPKAVECKNLLVPVCLSASHIAYGSIRMEPVFMALGQVAALAAGQVIETGKDVQQIDVGILQKELRTNPLSDGSSPDIFIDNTSEGVTVEGDWQTINRDAYGPDALVFEGSGGAYVRFAPQEKVEGNYEVFVYFAHVEGVSSKTIVVISSGDVKHEAAIEASSVRVRGQTRGEWISVGRYDMQGDVYMDITARGADGQVRADGVLMVKR